MRKRNHFAACLPFAILVISTMLLMTKPVEAGPPFFTDDPEPVPFRHIELYGFTTIDHASDGTTGLGPATEFNVGAAPNLQLHIIVPGAFNVPDIGPSAFGLGDTELGVKYRFVQETKSRPQIGTFPMLELATGSPSKGLGNGTTWARLPVWLQKSSGPWTTYGGAGYTINNAPGSRSYPFAGWLLQRDLNKKVTLGAELFGQGAVAVGAEKSIFFNAGGYYNFPYGLSLLFSGGHTVAGEGHTVGYLGLYWTWGPKRAAGGRQN